MTDERLRLVLCVLVGQGDGSDQTVMLLVLARRYCLSGPGNLSFYHPVLLCDLEILNIVVLSPVKECKEEDPAESIVFSYVCPLCSLNVLQITLFRTEWPLY